MVSLAGVLSTGCCCCVVGVLAVMGVGCALVEPEISVIKPTLSQIPSPEITQNSQGFTIGYSYGDDQCPTLGDDVQLTVNGVVTPFRGRGGQVQVSDDGDESSLKTRIECNKPFFVAPQGESLDGPLLIEIRDASATWRMEISELGAMPFVSPINHPVERGEVVLVQSPVKAAQIEDYELVYYGGGAVPGGNAYSAKQTFFDAADGTIGSKLWWNDCTSAGEVTLSFFINRARSCEGGLTRCESYGSSTPAALVLAASPCPH